MTVSVNIEVGRKKDALVLPIDSIEDLALQPSVLVIEDGKAAKRKIEVGIHDDRWVEVLAGLSEDEEILVHPDAVEVGHRVRAKKAAP
jgi:HlyD family secretion protein